MFPSTWITVMGRTPFSVETLNSMLSSVQLIKLRNIILYSRKSSMDIWCLLMALPKSGKGSGEQCKCLGEMTGKPTPRLSGILEFGLADQGDHQVVDRSHHFASMANRHPRGI